MVRPAHELAIAIFSRQPRSLVAVLSCPSAIKFTKEGSVDLLVSARWLPDDRRSSFTLDVLKSPPSRGGSRTASDSDSAVEAVLANPPIGSPPGHSPVIRPDSSQRRIEVK